MSFGDFTLDQTLSRFMARFKKLKEDYNEGLETSARAFIILLNFNKKVAKELKPIKDFLMDNLEDHIDITVANKKYRLQKMVNRNNNESIEVLKLED